MLPANGLPRNILAYPLPSCLELPLPFTPGAKARTGKPTLQFIMPLLFRISIQNFLAQIIRENLLAFCDISLCCNQASTGCCILDVDHWAFAAVVVKAVDWIDEGRE